MKYVVTGLIIMILILGLIISFQKCTIKKQNKKITEQNKIISVLNLQMKMTKYYIEIIEVMNENNQEKINKINKAKDKDITHIANHLFSYGVRKKNIHNTPGKN